MRLIFVYRGTSNPFSLLADFAHRLLYPETYECNLCDLTYDLLTMKRQWKAFIASLPVRSAFHLSDRFSRRYPEFAATPFPAVFIEDSVQVIRPLISKEEIDAATTLEQLQELIASRLPVGNRS